MKNKKKQKKKLKRFRFSASTNRAGLIPLFEFYFYNEINHF